jgi:hypothetical protein
VIRTIAVTPAPGPTAIDLGEAQGPRSGTGSLAGGSHPVGDRSRPRGTGRGGPQRGVHRRRVVAALGRAVQSRPGRPRWGMGPPYRATVAVQGTGGAGV